MSKSLDNNLFYCVLKLGESCALIAKVADGCARIRFTRSFLPLEKAGRQEAGWKEKEADPEIHS